MDHFFLSLYWICYNIASVFYVLFFWPRVMWDLSSPTRDRNCTPALEGKAREVPQVSLESGCHEWRYGSLFAYCFLFVGMNAEEKQRVGFNHSSSQDDRICCRYSKILQKMEPFVLLRLFLKMCSYYFCYCLTWIQTGMCLLYFTPKKP